MAGNLSSAEWPLPVVGHLRAGFVSRGIADLIDAVIVWVAAALLALGAAILRSVLVGSVLELPRLGAIAAIALPLVFVLYLWVFWTATGRTLGKLTMGLRLVTKSGGPVSSARAFGRALVCVVFPLGLVWAIVSTRSASLQDVMFGTAVVYDWNRPLPAERRGTRV